MNKRIIFLNQPQYYLNNVDHPSWKHYSNIDSLMSTHENFYLRNGNNSFPFNISSKDFPDIKMPNYEADFNLSFEQVTDLRCIDLHAKYNDRPWLILWSGGIDSTVILTSILKNINAADRKNIHVACNRISVYEYPEFFYKHIQPNFQIIDSTRLEFGEEILNKYYILSGELADQLYSGTFAQSMLATDYNKFTRNFRTQPDELITYISTNTNHEFATWFYEAILNNINSMEISMESYHDFFWWIQFNMTWVGMRLDAISDGRVKSSNEIKLFLTNYISWYSSNKYQHWSMHNNAPGIKYGKGIGDYKLASKMYIYEFNHDDYYKMFKTKLNSNGTRTKKKFPPFCLLDDFTMLDPNTELEDIISLLPTHINKN
jgi:hypothetical protein